MAPSQEYIRKLFGNLAKSDTQKAFFDQVSDDVNWFIIGSTVMSKTYHSKKDFFDATLKVLNNGVLTGPLQLETVNVIGGGSESDWSTTEMRAIEAKTTTGMTYDMRYCWCCKWDGEMIVQVRAYLDTDLLNRAVNQKSENAQ